MTPKILIIGLDCVPPSLLFDRFNLPVIKNLKKKSLYGTLKSIIPPITCPAWASMTTGYDAGSLGTYGFRARIKKTYNDFDIAHSGYIKKKRIWDYLGRRGLKSIIVGLPQTFPIKPLKGHLVSGFLTPSRDAVWTHPKSLAREIDKIIKYYQFDVRNFRTTNKARVEHELFSMTKKRFKLMKHLLKNKPWDFAFLMEIGSDRLHHAFWKYYDKTHRKYDGKSRFKNTIKNYYKLLDKEIFNLLKSADKDTHIFIVSDHGAKAMEGCFCINEWLIKKGYLVLKEYPKKIIPLREADIDWTKTKAWAWGGYYARVFLNVKGRELHGIIRESEYNRERNKLIKLLKNINDNRGEKIKNIIVAPENIYRRTLGDHSDIMAFIGNLAWRPIATIGYKKLYTLENDTGPDDAVHDWDGVILYYNPAKKRSKKITASILDIAPTILSLYGIHIPKGIEGKIIK